MPKQIILIMTDTQRIDMVSCYKNVGVSTPNIDALAAKGMKFNKAYTTQPVCGPARSALFTGQFPSVNGSYSNCNALGLNVKTIGQRLTDKGIHSGYIGKWHLDGGDYFGLGECAPGWDEKYWYDMRNYLDELTEEERVKSRDPKTMERENIEAEFTFGHRCADRAIDFINTYKDRDFFLVVSFDEPHDPSLAPEPFASMYKNYKFPKSPNVYDTLENKPEHQKVWSGNRRFSNREALDITDAESLGCNSFVDWEIGRVIDFADEALKDHKIIYTSDHGVMYESHSLYAKGPAAYEEITHIPFIISGFEKGESETPVSHIDVSSTIWDFFGFTQPQMMHGDSLLPILNGTEKIEKRDIFIEFGRYETDHDGFGGFQPMRCIYDGKYKLVINLLSDDELYDLENDPYEMENLINKEDLHQIRLELLSRLLDHMNEIRDPFRGYYWENRPWNKDAAAPTWSYTGYTRQREELDYEKQQLDYNTGLVAESLTRRK